MPVDVLNLQHLIEIVLAELDTNCISF